MNTISINRSNRTVSPLVATESIWNAPTMLSSSIPVGPWIHTKTGTTDVNKEIELPYSINAIVF